MHLPITPLCLSVLSLASCAVQPTMPQIQGSGEPARPASQASYDRAPDYIYRSAILFGQRRLDEDVWQPLENQILGAIEVSRVNAHTGNGYEFGLSGSYDDDDFVNGGDLDLLVLEFSAGFRVQKPQGKVRPFVGVGGALSYIEAGADLGFASGSEQTAAFGGYLHGGINFEIAREMDLVFEARQRIGQDADFDGVEFDLDYLTFAVGLSF